MSTNNAATPAAGVAGRERRNQGAEECVDGHVFPAEARKLNDAGWVFARSSIWKKGMTILATFLAVQAFSTLVGQYLKPKPTDTATSPAETQLSSSVPGSQSTSPSASNRLLPLWPPGTPLSLLVYLTATPDPLSPAPPISSYTTRDPVIRWDGLTYGKWDETKEEDLWVDVPESVQHNGTWWADLFLVAGVQDGHEAGHELQGGPMRVMRTRKLLTRYMPKRRVRKEKKLIASADDHAASEDEEQVEKALEQNATLPIVAYWAPNLTVTIISDPAPLVREAQSPVLQEYIQAEPTGLKDATGAGYYYPIVFPNDFWLLKENQYPINSTTTRLPLRVQYHPLSWFKFTIYASMSANFEAQQSAGGAASGTGAELDELKHMLLETNPWLLAVTITVTLLHMLFEFLAFSSDVQHWRKKDKSLVGVSLRTILTNCFVQLVIMLYLQDSSEETSFMVLAGQGIGLLIEAWKITKVVDVKVKPAGPGSFLPYSISFEDKKELSEDEKKTQEYDRLAFKIVGYFAAPIMLGYTIYSMLYYTHRGWYSFIITTLAQAIYMFGFAQLIPQLIINYKLKSVAHMPMKAMVYKTLGTVVDDFAAFVIRMPWLHRLACFRDDVVFLILLYQRWIYRVDPNRVNEYGQTIEGKVEPVGEKRVAGTVDEKEENRKDR